MIFHYESQVMKEGITQIPDEILDLLNLRYKDFLLWRAEVDKGGVRVRIGLYTSITIVLYNLLIPTFYFLILTLLIPFR